MKVGYLPVEAGDHLTVREQWRVLDDEDRVGWLETATGGLDVVRWDRETDECYCEPAGTRTPKFDDPEWEKRQRDGFQPAREMPTWATQKWLEVVAVDILPLSRLSGEDWAAMGLGDAPATLATILALHQEPGPSAKRRLPDKSRDAEAYAPWLKRRADPWISRIRVKSVPPGTWGWWIDGRKWEFRDPPNREPYGLGRF